MEWQQALELELEVAVADALQGGPATSGAVARARRNMRVVIDRWLAEGRIPSPITGYRLEVEGGRGLTIQLAWEEARTAGEVVVNASPTGR